MILTVDFRVSRLGGFKDIIQIFFLYVHPDPWGNDSSNLTSAYFFQMG